jgi:hypothetical protein
MTGRACQREGWAANPRSLGSLRAGWCAPNTLCSIGQVDFLSLIKERRA